MREKRALAGRAHARHLVELMKLKQVCSKAKMERIVADIRSAVDQGQKVIVFSQFTDTIMGLAVAARHRPPDGAPLVTLATAHPAKFPDAVERATGMRPPLPRHRLPPPPRWSWRSPWACSGDMYAAVPSA